MNGARGLTGDVPRETLERLDIYAGLLRKWNPAINIVAPSTLDDLWTRHIADSLQIARLAEPQGHWVDLGSGGGFPGVVIAIAHAENAAFSMTMIESDQRKATFIRTVLRETGVSAQVIADRIESAPLQDADVLTARALAALPKLLDFSARHRKPDGLSLFPKGASWREEIAEAERNWRFHYEASESTTNPGSVILKIGECTRG